MKHTAPKRRPRITGVKPPAPASRGQARAPALRSDLSNLCATHSARVTANFANFRQATERSVANRLVSVGLDGTSHPNAPEQREELAQAG